MSDGINAQGPTGTPPELQNRQVSQQLTGLALLYMVMMMVEPSEVFWKACAC